MDEIVVAWANDEFEAEMIQEVLEGAGIRSYQQQMGVSGPQVGFGLLNPGGGSRRVIVEASRAEEARALLAESLAEGEAMRESVDVPEFEEEAAAGRRPRSYGLIGGYARAYFWSFFALALAFGAFMLLRGV